MSLKNFYTKDRLKELGDYIEIGDHTYGCPKVFRWGKTAKLRIGKFCSIADEVAIFLDGEHHYEWITTYPFSGEGFEEVWPEAALIGGQPATKGDIEIGNDVWIGYGATILSGVKIGDGAVIAAQALVNKDVEPYSIVGGIPAKLIKKRFSDQDIVRLLQIKWWNWPTEKIRENMHLLCSGDIKNFLKL